MELVMPCVQGAPGENVISDFNDFRSPTVDAGSVGRFDDLSGADGGLFEFTQGEKQLDESRPDDHLVLDPYVGGPGLRTQLFER